jgi:[protein-PII] uridylyltransferase
MATKSFLSAADRKLASEQLKSPSRTPDGDEKKSQDFSSLEFSHWLGERLMERLSQHPEWLKSGPIALGSWARGELAPKSDIDMLFCGEEESVLKITQDFAKEDLKLRYRMPEDPNDWRIGVEPFDVLALYTAKPLTSAAEVKWREQKQTLDAESLEFRSDLIRAMTLERESREKRYDSISNYLEPNLKYGSGGLRDLEQALVAKTLFPDRFDHDSAHALQVLAYYKKFFLLVRQKLHLSEGASDLLSAPEQKPIATWLGFKDPKDFMREIQKGVSRVSFYADWVIEQATRPQKRIAQVKKTKVESVEQLFGALEKDPSLLMQNRVRRSSDGLFGKARSRKARLKPFDRALGRSLTKFIAADFPEAPLVALFRARLIDQCVPEFRKIVGHVQHDQYHRYTVDAHILQALRELKRLKKHPGLAGKLKTVVRSLSKREWEILAFSCLYHDIAKGREGDHSQLGIDIAKKDLHRFGKSESLAKEVLWIVKEHLSLSVAAFRENAHSPTTWQNLAEKGVSGRRLALLAVFTIVDIRATNPEAWTPWKERLLSDLVTQLERPEASASIAFGGKLKAKRLSQDWLEKLDPFLISSVASQALTEDLKTLSEKTRRQSANSESGHESKDEFDLNVIRSSRGKQTWVRFHTANDRPGLFLSYVSLLSKSGFSIRHASVLTDPTFGVYDWFEVKTTKAPLQVRKLLEVSGRANAKATAPSSGKNNRPAPVVEFQSVELISSDQKEWVISFRGQDQSGALWSAANALFSLGASIRWAKVHTWGRQIDDIFGVDRIGNEGPEAFVSRLKNRLGSP